MNYLQVYGDLAKYLHPGVVGAMKCYLRLPRKKGIGHNA